MKLTHSGLPVALVVLGNCIPTTPLAPMAVYPVARVASSDYESLLPSVKEKFERKYPGAEILKMTVATDRWEQKVSSKGVRERLGYVDMAFRFGGTCLFSRRVIYNEDNLGSWGPLEVGGQASLDEYREWLPAAADGAMRMGFGGYDQLPLIDCNAVK